jgi:hypothetical protein
LAVWQLSGDGAPRRTLFLACAATLVLSPLLPHGTAGGSLHLDELTLALAAEVASGDLPAALRDLDLARSLLWLGAAAGLAIALASEVLASSHGRWLAWAGLAGAIAPAAALAAALRFHWRWTHLDQITPGWNYVLPAGALAALGLQAWTSWRLLRPFGGLTLDPLARKT